MGHEIVTTLLKRKSDVENDDIVFFYIRKKPISLKKRKAPLGTQGVYKED
jgi:hypothetical protein